MPNEEKRLAKLQDRNFCEFRKNQILQSIKPSTEAFNMKKFDESFPRTKRNERNMDIKQLDAGTYEFGREMHKYLIMRPDPRFATWQGRKLKKHKTPVQKGPNGSVEKLEKKPLVNIATKKGSKETKKQTNVKQHLQKQIQNNLIFQNEVEEEDVDHKRIKEALQFLTKEDVEGKPHYMLNAIVDNKPFWLIGDPIIPEDEEDDDYVDAKMLSDYINKKIKVTCNPVERKKFAIWGPTPQLCNETKHYGDKKLIIANTLTSICESNQKRGSKKRVDNSTPCKLKFNETVKCLDYVMESMPIEKTAIYEGKLENHVRVKTTTPQ